MIPMEKIGKALINLAPNCYFRLYGETYESLEWMDENTPKPTKKQVEDEIVRIEAEYVNNEYQRKRKSEYPPITDYLDAVVKGDEEQIQEYIDACLAVKAKYPKPE
jgi:hypothetical protein